MKLNPGDRLIDEHRRVCRILRVHPQRVQVVFEKPINGPTATIEKLYIGEGRRWQKKGRQCRI